MSSSNSYNQLGGDSPGVCSSVKSLRILSVTVALVALACVGAIVYLTVFHEQSSGSAGPTPTPPEPPVVPAELQHFIDNMLADMNKTADPCDDFYEYACGGWMASTQLPSDSSRYTRSFGQIVDRNNLVLSQVLAEDWPILQQFYDSCMDLDTIDQRSTRPIDAMIDQLKHALEVTPDSTVETLLNSTFSLLGEWFGQYGLDFFFSAGVGADPRNPLLNILMLGQGGAVLPRDYYLDERYADILSTYQKHIATQLSNLGEEQPPAMAAVAVAHEKLMANISKPAAEMRDPEATYNKMSLEQLQARYPLLMWRSFFDNAELDPNDFEINVDNPDFFAKLNAFFEEQRSHPELLAPVIRDYLVWQVLNDHVSLLSQPFLNASFAFFGKFLSGQDEPSPRNKTCIAATDSALGELLGRYYVQRAFSGESKPLALELVNRIEAAFAANLASVDWLDKPTRAAAKQKLDMVSNMIGYPDKWTDYSSLSLSPVTYFDNVMETRQMAVRKSLGKLGHKVDRTEWGMTPPTVNAYYDPSANQMVFPAGIIQPTYFDKNYPAASNYGGIGMVMGHELTHGFDDQGSQYDGTGNLTKWWPEAITKKFIAKTDCIVRQYSQYELYGEHLDGRLTLGENLADNGGIKLAHIAFQKFMQEQHQKNASANANANANADLDDQSIVPGLTNDQLFFVSFAQGWCEIATKGRTIQQIKTDPHSPARFRVKGPLTNLDAFAAAFKCPVGSNMNPKNKCYVW